MKAIRLTCAKRGVSKEKNRDIYVVFNLKNQVRRSSYFHKSSSWSFKDTCKEPLPQQTGKTTGCVLKIRSCTIINKSKEKIHKKYLKIAYKVTKVFGCRAIFYSTRTAYLLYI